jgi:hypothetical protein
LRFFFHLKSGDSVFEDTMGDDFLTIEEALAHARTVATELGREGGHERQQAVIVANAKREELAVVPVGRDVTLSSEI